MAVNTREFTLDVSKQPTVMKVLRLAQGDHNGTTVKVAVTDAGAPLDLAGYDVYWAMLLPDGETFYRKDGTASGNVATVTIDERYAASVPGTTTVAYLEIRDGDELIASTERITVRISESAENGVTEARSWDSFVQRWLDGLQEVREAQESAYAEAERARESLFAQAESARASEESLRALAEDGRERAESSRAGAEEGRAAAESGRESAEAGRAAAEGARELAEEGRAARFAAIEAAAPVAPIPDEGIDALCAGGELSGGEVLTADGLARLMESLPRMAAADVDALFDE